MSKSHFFKKNLFGSVFQAFPEACLAISPAAICPEALAVVICQALTECRDLASLQKTTFTLAYASQFF